MPKRHIKIQQLVHQSKYYKFEINRINFKYFGTLAISTIIAIPSIILIPELTYKSLIAVMFIIIFSSITAWYIIESKQANKKIKHISKLVHDTYESLLE